MPIPSVVIVVGDGPWRQLSDGAAPTERPEPPGAVSGHVHFNQVRPASLELHVHAFGDVLVAEAGGNGDAAAHLLLGGVNGPDGIAAGAEERVGVRRLGLRGVKRGV